MLVVARHRCSFCRLGPVRFRLKFQPLAPDSRFATTFEIRHASFASMKLYSCKVSDSTIDAMTSYQILNTARI